MNNDNIEDFLDLQSSSNHNGRYHDRVNKQPENIIHRGILKPQEKQVFQQSVNDFSNIKRKYQQRFLTKDQSSKCSQESQQEDDKLQGDSSRIKSQQGSIIKSQKQLIKKLQQQNRFLKQKIDDITFRLKQTQVQLNKLKYNGNNNSANYQSMKQSCLKQLAQLMAKNQGDNQTTCQAYHRLKSMVDFDGKIKIDLMNYLMSELLQNIINDSTFYIIDSILTQKGLWRDKNTVKKRKMDQEFIQCMGLEQNKNQQQFKKDLYEPVLYPAQKYKKLWKEFYRSYINLLNQGFVLQNFLRNTMKKITIYLPRQNFVKLQLHFQAIKLRRDNRQLRQSWFKQFQFEEQNSNQLKQQNSYKKSKLQLR